MCIGFMANDIQVKTYFGLEKVQNLICLKVLKLTKFKSNVWEHHFTLPRLSAIYTKCILFRNKLLVSRLYINLSHCIKTFCKIWEFSLIFFLNLFYCILFLIVADPCLTSPCRNGGQCMTFGLYFVCLCQRPFGGETCEVLEGMVDDL